MKTKSVLVFAVINLTAVLCLSAPKPAIVPAPDLWTVDVRFEHLQQIELKQKGKPARFWFVILTLTNNTGQDVEFYPKCDLLTDTYQLLPAGENVPNAVFKQIKGLYKQKYPFLELWEKAGNRLLQGEDNSKDIAIIWPDFDNQAKNAKLYIAGLSNETAVVDHPTQKDKDGKPVKIFLRKTLELSYDIAGDPAFRPSAKVTFAGKEWVMR